MSQHAAGVDDLVDFIDEHDALLLSYTHLQAQQQQQSLSM
jgi:hypothetical protein